MTHTPMNDEISRDLLGKIVDEVFDGGLEDASVIEDIYRVIKREERLTSTNSAERGVAVKPLEWETHDNNWWEASPPGMGYGYEVRLTDRGKVFTRTGRGGWEYFEGSVEEAEAVAQAHFEAVVLSTISPSPKPVEARPKLADLLEGEKRAQEIDWGPAVTAVSNELEEARTEIERLKDLLGDPEGVSAHADAITSNLDAELAEAREVMRPFAILAEIFDVRAANRPSRDDEIIATWAHHKVLGGIDIGFTVGDLRRARSFIKEGGK